MKKTYAAIGFAACLAVGGAFGVGYRMGYNRYVSELGEWQQMNWADAERKCDAGELADIRIECGDVHRLAYIARVVPNLLK
jgi:hypothetical protein